MCGILNVRYSAGKLADKLNIESKKLWSSRSIVDRLILIDWCSNLDGDSNSPLWTLRNILENVNIIVFFF